MKALACLAATFALCGSVLAETAGDWRPLFNGRDLEGWRLFGSDKPPGPGWKVVDGTLVKAAGVRGGDIVTKETFTDFEFSWEWKVAAKGNNGVKYLVTEARKGAPGPEYQLLDDSGHPDGKIGPHRQTAAFYDVLPPATDKPMKPIGEWNASRIVVKGNHVEHWLNGKNVLTYVLGSAAVKAGLAKSKFTKQVGFGEKIAGHIMLTYHQDDCWYRNIKIRELK